MKAGNQYRNHFFDDFMFGKKMTHLKTDREYDIKGQIQSIEKLLEEFDLNELMENIDFIVDAAKQLKPYVNKLSPFLKQILNK